MEKSIFGSGVLRRCLPGLAWSTYLVGAVERGKCVGVGSLAQCEGVGDLEEGVEAEGLCEIGAQATEHVVVEENIALNLFCQALNGARVGQAELCAPSLEGIVCISHRPCYRVIAEECQRMTRRRSHGCHCGGWKRSGSGEDVRSNCKVEDCRLQSR